MDRTRDTFSAIITPGEMQIGVAVTRANHFRQASGDIQGKVRGRVYGKVGTLQGQE